MIFRYKGFAKESWRNVARKYLADADVCGSKEGVWHHFSYFPDRNCAIGLRKTSGSNPPVLSTPDVYKSHICFNEDGSIKDVCEMCTCEDKTSCPKFESKRTKLGPERLRIMEMLRDSPVVSLGDGESPLRERRLEISSSVFSYGAHFMPTATHSTDYDVNCNVFNKLWEHEPERIFEYIDHMHHASGAPAQQVMHRAGPSPDFVGIGIGGEGHHHDDRHHRFLRVNDEKS